MTTLPTFAIAVLDKGFVYVGHIHLADGFLTISKAHNIRKWGTTAGLGQLAEQGPLTGTQLDKCPDVFVPFHALVHLMTVNLEKWGRYANP